jgi:hypothetical protein
MRRSKLALAAVSFVSLEGILSARQAAENRRQSSHGQAGNLSDVHRKGTISIADVWLHFSVPWHQIETLTIVLT